MQNLRRILLIALICLQLCGCSETRQVENQAYVLAMGIDHQENGRIIISTMIPKIAGSSAEDATAASQGSQGNYLHVSVEANNYEAALEKLNWAVPRDLNLSQLKTIVLSKELVEKNNMNPLIEDLARTERLFTAAQLIVCDGKAADFLKALQPAIGSRISNDLDATMEHYARFGLIPNSTLATMFYLTNSVYSDPLLAFAIAKPDNRKQNIDTENKAVVSQTQSIQETIESIDSDIKTQYLGSAVFSNGEFKGIFNEKQTILANLLNNSLHLFRYTCENECMEFTPIGNTKIHINTNVHPAVITIKLSLSIANQDKEVDTTMLEAVFKRDIIAVLQTAQQYGVEPFGFAESAVKNFSTLDDWQEYNWKRRFQEAQFEIKLDLRYANP